MAEFLSLSEAVSKNLDRGNTVCFEGFTHLIPHASAHEVIRQKIGSLTIIRMTPDVIYDQLIGMSLVKKMIFSYAGNPGVGLLRRFRDSVENGWPNKIEIEEHSHSAMAHAYELPVYYRVETSALQHIHRTSITITILKTEMPWPRQLTWRIVCNVIVKHFGTAGHSWGRRTREHSKGTLHAPVLSYKYSK